MYFSCPINYDMVSRLVQKVSALSFNSLALVNFNAGKLYLAPVNFLALYNFLAPLTMMWHEDYYREFQPLALVNFNAHH